MSEFAKNHPDLAHAFVCAAILGTTAGGWLAASEVGYLTASLTACVGTFLAVVAGEFALANKLDPCPVSMRARPKDGPGPLYR